MVLDQIQTDLASAQKDRDQIRIDTLRFLLGAIFNFQIEKYPHGDRSQLTDSDVLSVISKQVKTHRESIDMFTKASRNDLVEREQAELTILQTYLPAQLSEEEIRVVVQKIKEANPQADFPILMKQTMAQLQGKADGSLVAKLVKEGMS